ncbi:hypothetical protein OGAPHI_003053 [Ogataea philodendri]|uniref:Uncharacterized protein n=1 Tax=Ogataea philodendri TaxID=1378263 RepID=A0A9P8P9J1_9ASCO|nr:uncharacterized protein OGAPHI_003053 [Ogataea philodendri]KAH3667404.1 hypothetical protein OGAPHI_003053 [Ogataea philodendri]
MDEPADQEDGGVESVVKHSRVLRQSVAQLPFQDVPGNEESERNKQERRQPPNNRVAQKIHLSVSFLPVGNTSLEEWPGLWSGLENVRSFESLVDLPHDLVRTDIVGMQTSVGQGMVESDFCSVEDWLERGWWLRHVVELDTPFVVCVEMWIQSHLLLAGSSLVERVVRVEVAAVGLDVFQGDDGADSHVCQSGLRHGCVFEGGSERRREEGCSVTFLVQQGQMDLERDQVNDGWNDQKCHKFDNVLLDDGFWRLLQIANGEPELDGRGGADPNEGEQTDPFGRAGESQTRACQDERFPPVPRERSFYVELGGRVGCGSNEEQQRGVQQHETGDCHVCVFQHKQCGRQKSHDWFGTGCSESQVQQDNGSDTQDGTKLSHENVWNVGREHVADLGELKLAVESSQSTHCRK